ncbi:hypothetical protein TKK_0001081 [Trichogramma kaykai]
MWSARWRQQRSHSADFDRSCFQREQLLARPDSGAALELVDVDRSPTSWPLTAAQRPASCHSRNANCN